MKISKRWQAYGWLLLNTVCWGAALVVVKPALSYVTAFEFLFYRFVLAGVLTLPWLIKLLLQARWRHHLPKLILNEVLGVIIYLALLYEGLARTSAIEASLLTTTLPFFVILAGVIVLKEKQTGREWRGFVLSFVGILMISVLPLLNQSGLGTGVSIGGNLLVLLANVAGALYYVTAKRWYKKVPKLLAAMVGFWVGAIGFGVLAVVMGQGGGLIGLAQIAAGNLSQPAVLFASLYMAIAGSIIGLTAYIKGQDLIEASEASLFDYLQPLIYLPLGIIFLGELISLGQVLGLALVVVGGIVAQQPFSKKRV